MLSHQKIEDPIPLYMSLEASARRLVVGDYLVSKGVLGEAPESKFE